MMRSNFVRQLLSVVCLEIVLMWSVFGQPSGNSGSPGLPPGGAVNPLAQLIEVSDLPEEGDAAGRNYTNPVEGNPVEGNPVDEGRSIFGNASKEIRHLLHILHNSVICSIKFNIEPDCDVIIMQNLQGIKIESRVNLIEFLEEYFNYFFNLDFNSLKNNHKHNFYLLFSEFLTQLDGPLNLYGLLPRDSSLRYLFRKTLIKQLESDWVSSIFMDCEEYLLSPFDRNLMVLNFIGITLRLIKVTNCQNLLNHKFNHDLIQKLLTKINDLVKQHIEKYSFYGHTALTRYEMSRFRISEYVLARLIWIQPNKVSECMQNLTKIIQQNNTQDALRELIKVLESLQQDENCEELLILIQEINYSMGLNLYDNRNDCRFIAIFLLNNLQKYESLFEKELLDYILSDKKSTRKFSRPLLILYRLYLMNLNGSEDQVPVRNIIYNLINRINNVLEDYNINEDSRAEQDDADSDAGEGFFSGYCNLL